MTPERERIGTYVLPSGRPRQGSQRYPRPTHQPWGRSGASTCEELSAAVRLRLADSDRRGAARGRV